MKIPHISVSRKGTWEECQVKYKFRYHLDVMPPTEAVYFTFGKVVHRAIELYTKERGKRLITDIALDILAGTIPLEDRKPAAKPEGDAPQEEPKEEPIKPVDLPTEYRNKLNAHLRNFLRLTEKIGLEGDVEWPFRIDLDPPNERYLVGFIDRIIRKGNDFTVLDWKTSKVSRWRKDERTITKDLQMQTYCWLITKYFDVPAKNVQAALYYLEDGKLVPVRYSEQTLAEVPKQLAAVHKEIQCMPPEKAYGNVGYHCERCDYRKICPFWSLT